MVYVVNRAGLYLTDEDKWTKFPEGAKQFEKEQDAVDVCAILRSRSCKVLPYVIS